jgi:dual specificity phosphatase 3
MGMDNNLKILEPAAWWRTLCFPVPKIAISGDLNSASTACAVTQLGQWQSAGITDIVDMRAEQSDAALVSRHAPNMSYHWVGTHDDGSRQPDEVFDAAVGSVLNALADPDRKVLVHCHMGVNRGPSAGFAAMLALGHNPVEALSMIRSARPIAAIIYASDALDWWHRRSGTPARQRIAEQAAVEDWFDANPIDTAWVISRIWRASSSVLAS